ncbi:hypothetical protein T440DRAFT_472781 [Plenodomus tracheiphilus IPT5]|uniref:Ubiquitin-like protease family profile domain-containing protein n=1 Tax=Plenodomus tracheiphilus IPT5 TaxID=1408161 RepID=A0A6A7ASQ7_9PLEO|nr:hypothetical protein T440DRAFT_472781 [Plenodomus tracheiphilus IPT5]
MLSNLIEDVRAAAGKALGFTNIDDHDAAAQPPDMRSPPHSYARGSAPSSRTVIDLSSPVKHARPPQRKAEAPNRRPRPRPARQSEDELRLVGDFSTPADAVACPDPQSWNPVSHRTPRTTMKNKPGASESFRPIDTLTQATSGSSRPRHVTYGKHSRPMPQTIGRARHEGQQAYLEAVESRAFTSSAKRRKTKHVIELDDDDQVQHMAASHSPHTPARTVHTTRPTSARSQRQGSAASGASLTAGKNSSQTQSEFRAADQRITHGKPRRSTVKGQGFEILPPVGKNTATSPSKGSAQEAYVTVSDDEEATPRKLILERFQQGSAESSQRQAVVTSRHFPNARINESTSECPGPSTATRPPKSAEETHLRDDFRPPPRKVDDPDDSLDELAVPYMQVPIAKSRLPSKAVQAANRDAKRKKRTVSAIERYWQLNYARSRDFTHTGPNLRMRHGTDQNYVIQMPDNDHNYCHAGNLDLSRVSKIYADDISRIRLTGGRDSDGYTYIIDLEFVDTDQFICFRDDYAVAQSGLKKFFQRTETYMQNIFERAQSKDNQGGKVPDVPDIGHLEVPLPTTKTQSPSDKSILIDQIRAYVKSPKDRRHEGVVAVEALSEPTRTSTRPTRSSAKFSDLFDVGPADHQEIEKYSVKHGLGPPWRKPLEYGQGKQRATVHFEDLPRLDEEEFLNDSLIDFYMIHLFNKHKVSADKVYFFNTYFYTALTKETGRKSMNYAKVARWTQKIDIFGYDHIIIPINEATHWYLAIICNVSSIDRKPVIEDFNDKASTTVGRGRQNDMPQDMSRQPTSMAEGGSSPLSIDKAQPFEETANRPSSVYGEGANLFEECSQLNLVDPHESGLQTEAPTTDGNDFNELLNSTVLEEPAGHIVLGSKNEKIRNNFRTQSTLQKSRKPKKRPHVPQKKDPNQPIVIILDSLGQTRSGAVRALKDWISAEGKAKRGMDADIKENGYYPKSSQIPTQSNWSDCGVYLLGYVDKFFQNPDGFKNKLLTGEMSVGRDWSELDPQQIRNRMRETLFACMKEQDAARSHERMAKLADGKTNALQPSTKRGHSNSEAQDRRTPPVVNTEAHTTASLAAVSLKALEPSIQDASPRKSASPFNFKHRSLKPGVHTPPLEGSWNTSHSTPVSASRTEHITSNYVQRGRRHGSPMVRISRKSPEIPRNGEAKSMETLPPGVEGSREASNLLGSTNNVRHKEDHAERISAVSERFSGMLPRKQGASRSKSSSLVTNSKQDGSTSTVYVEPESQGYLPEPIASPERTPANPSTMGQATVEVSPTRRMLRAAPSLGHPSVSLETGGDERHSRVQSPMLMNGLLETAEEALPDVMDIDSPSADAMVIDSMSRGSEVQETPEPDEGFLSSVDREQSPLLM